MGAALASWAVANGVEDDVMGNPIAKQWLSGAARRLLTVQPETGEAPIRSTPADQPAAASPPRVGQPVGVPRLEPPAPPPLIAPPPPPSTPFGAGPLASAHMAAPMASAPPAGASDPARKPRQRAATIIEEARVASSIDQRRATARQAVYLTIGIVLLGAAAVAIFLVRDRSGQGSTVPTATAVATDTASAAPSSAPSATASASDDPSARPVGAAPSADASSSASSSARVPIRFPRRPKAPPAPKNIKF
jgi:hypothetical protein